MARPAAAAAALLPAVLLAVLAPWAGRGGAAAPAAPNGTLEAELERRWDSLVARSLARLPVAAQPKEAAVQSGAGDYLLGIKRLRRLYCNVGIGFHIQVLRDGRIGGVHADTSDSECGVPTARAGGLAPRPPLLTRANAHGGPGLTPARGPKLRPLSCAGAGTRTRPALAVAAGTGRAHSAGPAPPPRPRKPGLRTPNSSDFARGHRAQGARRSHRHPPGRGTRARVAAGLGDRRAGHGAAVRDWARPPRGRDRDRRRASPRPRTLGSWGPFGVACEGEPGPVTPRGPGGTQAEEGAGAGGAGQGSAAPE